MRESESFLRGIFGFIGRAKCLIANVKRVRHRVIDQSRAVIMMRRRGSFSGAGMLYVSLSYLFFNNLLHEEFYGYKFSGL